MVGRWLSRLERRFEQRARERAVRVRLRRPNSLLSVEMCRFVFKDRYVSSTPRFGQVERVPTNLGSTCPFELLNRTPKLDIYILHTKPRRPVFLKDQRPQNQTSNPPEDGSGKRLALEEREHPREERRATTVQRTVQRAQAPHAHESLTRGRGRRRASALRIR